MKIVDGALFAISVLPFFTTPSSVDGDAFCSVRDRLLTNHLFIKSWGLQGFQAIGFTYFVVIKKTNKITS